LITLLRSARQDFERPIQLARAPAAAAASAVRGSREARLLAHARREPLIVAEAQARSSSASPPRAAPRRRKQHPRAAGGSVDNTSRSSSVTPRPIPTQQEHSSSARLCTRSIDSLRSSASWRLLGSRAAISAIRRWARARALVPPCRGQGARDVRRRRCPALRAAWGGGLAAAIHVEVRWARDGVEDNDHAAAGIQFPAADREKRGAPGARAGHGRSFWY
jgi:hypothetical protein